LIHHVAGMESREHGSPSWLNLAECVQVMHYLRSLRDDRNIWPKVNFAEDVVIIAPYQAQVKKLRIFLQHEGMSACRVGSVENFQGSESRIVIVTTCRSSSLNDDYDALHHVGFLKNEKRFNVAITRAKELLIVVGNVAVLSSDYHWSVLIKRCQSLGVVVGF
ncbi:MAG TPA: C-terminal helicase domain-containing protein, partial [Blastocatellia bacterium]|nr:C-terminal helicase domain-containing protein [Blastocatellia bacterium]